LTCFRKMLWCQISWETVPWEPICSMRTKRHADSEADSPFSRFCKRTCEW